MSASLKRKQSVCVTALICVVALSACTDGDYYEILDEYGNVADSRTLSAGKSTVFQSGVSAYDTPADWVTGNLSTRFYQGDALYDNPRVSGDDPRRAARGLCMPAPRAAVATRTPEEPTRRSTRRAEPAAEDSRRT